MSVLSRVVGVYEGAERRIARVPDRVLTALMLLAAACIAWAAFALPAHAKPVILAYLILP